MKRYLIQAPVLAALLVTAILLPGCGASVASQPPPPPTPTASPTPLPKPTTIYFTSSDGVKLGGEIFGKGKTALIFSNGNGVQMWLWEYVARAMADRGYMSFLYDYRGVGTSEGENDPTQRVHDLRAAVVSARAHGATKVVLLGASFGGLLAAKLAVESHAVAVVTASAALTSAGLTLSDAELRAFRMPKLLIASENDSRYADNAQHILALAPQPTQLVIYPGDQHGTSIFDHDHRADAMARLVAFLDQYAPA